MALKKVTEALREWQRHNEEVRQQTTVNHAEKKADQLARIRRARKDYAYFVEYYFPHFAKCKTGKFQVKAANYILQNKNSKAVFKWARAHAKSTHMDVFIPLWLKCQEARELNVMVIVGKSSDNANTLLSDIQSELQYNQRYINDFGEQYNSGHWAEGSFVTRDGCAFFALGRGQSPRGLRYRDQRPDYIVIDDLDDDELCQNESRVSRLTDWVKEALFGTLDGGRGRFIMVGNLIGKTSVLQRVSEIESVHVSQVNIYDKNGNVTWAEKWTKAEVLEMEKFMGYRSFQKEYMNNPITEGAVFRDEDLVFAEIPPLNKFRFLVAYGDPSPSNNVNDRKNSTKALWLVGYCESKFYVIYGFLDRVINDEFVDWFYLVENYVKQRTQIYNYIENNTLQAPFFDQVFMPLFYKKGAERNHHIGIIADPRKKPDKFSRIEGNLEPLVRTGRLIFNIKEKDNPNFKRLIEQFKLFSPSMKAPADGPDAIEGGVFICNNKILSVTGEGESLISGFGKVRKNRL
ncbi:MAG: hypothetical protein RBT57_02840 [Paludibacter sp.]|jgi:hypothetical protein|nr:hypothetical protein [Paludibacter sp.]